MLISDAPGNTIGGTAQERNIISGNGLHGVHIERAAASMNMVEANYIGTNSLGDTALPNGRHGVRIARAPNNRIGEPGGVGNLISGNSQHGVLITGSGADANWVVRNFIGADVGGTAPLPNGGDGVRIAGGARRNLVGGGAPGQGNTIAFNGQSGVVVTDQTVDNGIRRNAIFDNAGLGIDLGDDGVTPNDGLDDDTGPNNLQNFPVLFVVFNDPGPPARTFVLGELQSTPDTTYALEFFSNPACDPSGHGQGRTFVGSTLVTTDGSGNASFSTLLLSLGRDQFLTATATLPFGVIIGVGFTPEGDTSEFSRCAEALPPPCPSAQEFGVAITKVWDGEGLDELWENPINWTGNILPGPTDNVCIGPGFNVILSSVESIRGLFNSGTLAGTGLIEADLVSNAGTVGPGASAGILTITGDYTQTDTGTLVIEIGGLEPGAEHDQLAVSGTVSLDGALEVSLIDPSTLGPGQQFLIVEIGDTLDGRFAGLAELAVAGNFGGRDLYITYAGGDGNDIVLFTSVRADFDQDGDVDQNDLAMFVGCMTGPELLYDPDNLPFECDLAPDAKGFIAADGDRDGDVDLLDYTALVRW